MNTMDIVRTSFSGKPHLFSKNNEIHFSDEVSYSTMHSLIETLKNIEAESLRKLRACETNLKLSLSHEDELYVSQTLTLNPIKLFITTNGGSIYAALQAMDIIQSLRVPVHTIASGYVASAGTLLSLAGAKRFIMPHSFMLIHELRTGFWGKYSDSREHVENMDKLMKVIVDFMTKKTKIKAEELESILKRDKTWDAQECIGMGMADEIYEQRV